MGRSNSVGARAGSPFTLMNCAPLDGLVVHIYTKCQRLSLSPLTYGADMANMMSLMSTNQQVSTAEFFATRRVFSLDEAAAALNAAGGRAGVIRRLKHHLKSGRLLRLERELYAVVPVGVDRDQYNPDLFLTARAARPEGIFSHHSALELLGLSRTVFWNRCTMYVSARRRPLTLPGGSIEFLQDPMEIRSANERTLAMRQVTREGFVLRVTGPERTLVEGFRNLPRVGGLEELVTSVAGMPVLDLELLARVLTRYGKKYLWGACGWFLEQHRKTFHVPEAFLTTMSKKCPRRPQYIERGERGGTLFTRWNVIVPGNPSRLSEPDVA